jgi:hypothetical protein
MNRSNSEPDQRANGARPPRALESLSLNTVLGRSKHYHLRILMARLHLKAAEHELREAVLDAVDAGASWTTVGAALGTSRQNAQQRYGRRPSTGG